MNFPENKPAPESPERKALIELKKAHASLRLMFHLLALCTLMLTGTLFILLYKQVSLLRREIDAKAAEVAEYQKVFVPQIEAVRVSLDSFAKTNESLRPLLRRYFPTNSAPKPSAPASTNK